MRIAMFGSSLLSSYWNGAATYYRGLVKALHTRGHRITFFEPDAFGRQQHRDLAEAPPWAEVVVWDADRGEDAVFAALDAARRADLVVKTSGVGVFDELLEREVAMLRSPSRTVAFWDVDAPATLERIAADPGDPMRRIVPQFDLVFTYGGGRRVVDGYRALGARACVPIYNAHDPATHHPVDPDPRFRFDLAFLGNRLPDREQRVRAFFFAAAEAAPERSFAIGGNGWNHDELPHNVEPLGHVGTADHNAFNSTPLAVLNVNRDSMAGYGWSPATRIFEAAAAGACIVSDSWAGIDAFLEPDEEILLAHDGREVAELLGGLDPLRARTIGRRARRRVLREHTYAARAADVEAVLDGREPRQSFAARQSVEAGGA